MDNMHRKDPTLHSQSNSCSGLVFRLRAGSFFWCWGVVSWCDRTGGYWCHGLGWGGVGWGGVVGAGVGGGGMGGNWNWYW